MKTSNFFNLFFALVSLVILLIACGSPFSESPSVDVAKSDLQRVVSPDIPSNDFQILIDGNNVFALDIYQSLRSQSGNLILSPYSISIALGMTYAGARSETESQMVKTLHYDLPQGQLHPAFNSLDQALVARGMPKSEDEAPFQLNIANSVWAEQTFPFKQEYLDVIAQNYGAGIQLADFLNQHETVRREINQWVSEQTQDRIQDLLQKGAIDPETKMVLVNAIYFKGDWAVKFDPNSTRNALFHLIDGSETQVEMMGKTINGIPYTKGNGFQAIELAYQGDTAVMEIIVPDEGNFVGFESELDSAKLDAIFTQMQSTMVELGLPKFNFTSDFDLSEQLSQLGMPNAFDENRADFSGMTGERDVYIDDVIHKAFVTVDEKGTEAAAATAVVVAPSSMEQIEPIILIIDRPFIFVIRDKPSGQILFIGRVINPSK